MAEYITSIAVASCVIGLLEFLCYSSKTRDAARICASILVLHAVLTPLLGLAVAIKDGELELDIGFTQDSIEGGVCEEVAEEAFKDGICKLLYTNYGINEKNAEVAIVGFDFEKMKADKIIIVLSGAGALADYRSIEEYVTEAGLGECEVRIRIG